MLDKVDFPLSNAQVCEFILEKEYTSYFNLQQSISELVEANFLRVETVRNTSLYHITEEGENTLEYFGRRISDAIKEEIDQFLQEHGYELRNEVSTRADYYKTAAGEYAARCLVKEKDATLIELTLTVPLEEQAASICNNWKQKNQQIYSWLMQELL